MQQFFFSVFSSSSSLLLLASFLFYARASRSIHLVKVVFWSTLTTRQLKQHKKLRYEKIKDIHAVRSTHILYLCRSLKLGRYNSNETDVDQYIGVEARWCYGDETSWIKRKKNNNKKIMQNKKKRACLVSLRTWIIHSKHKSKIEKQQKHVYVLLRNGTRSSCWYTLRLQYFSFQWFFFSHFFFFCRTSSERKSERTKNHGSKWEEIELMRINWRI